MSLKSIAAKVLLFLLLISNNTKGQFFGLRQSNPRIYYHSVLKYPKDSLYRVYSIRYPISANQNVIQPIIFVFGKNLQLKDSIVLPKNHAFNFSGPIEFNSKLYWTCANNSYTCGYTGVDVCYGDSVSIVTFDLNYHVVSKNRITIDNNYDHPSLVKYPGGFLYGHESFINFPFGIEKIFKLSNQLNKIDSIRISSVYANPISFVQGKIFIPGQDLPAPCQPIQPNSGDRTSLILDTNLIAVSCDTYSNLGTYTFNTSPLQTAIIQCKSYPMPYLAQISETKYLIFGNQLGFFKGNFPQFNSHYGIVLAIKDQNKNVIKSHFFGNDFYETTFSEVGKFFDVDKNNIAFVARVDSLGSGNFNPTLNMRSKIMLVKIDTLGNVLFKKYYGGDMYYQPRSLIFTADGGYLISGIRFDSTASAIKGMPGISESFLLKLDSNGNYNAVNIHENGRINKNVVKAFPNPATGQIQFDCPLEYSYAISIMSVDGKCVYHNKQYINYNKIALTYFPQGLYFFEIKTNYNIYSGKFVKE